MNNMGDYPVGAKYDPNAPWNEKQDFDKIVNINKYGEIELISRIYINEEEINDEKNIIDPYYLDKFLIEKLNINSKKLEEAGESVEIINLLELKNDKYLIITKYGILKTSFEKLYNLL